MSASSNFKISLLDGSDSVAMRRWDDFVFSCVDATFFHRAGWAEILENVFKHKAYFFYAECHGVLLAILPLAHVKSRLFGNSLVGLPFAVYGGPVGDVDAIAVLELEAKKLALHLAVDYLEFRQQQALHGDWGQQNLYVTFRKKIFSTDDENMLAIPRKQRAMVRKGIARNLFSVVDEGVDRFFLLYADNVRRHGTPALPKSYFQALLRVFAESCEVLLVCDSQKQVLSGVFSFYFKNEVLPYYAGDTLLARESAANDFKYWELMRRATVRGIEIFDFGRSKKDTGSFDFKKNWGFESQPLHYVYDLYRLSDVPQHNPSNSKYRMAIAAWRHLPLGLTNWLGPKVVRALG